MFERASVIAGAGPAGPRSVKDVPFVELFGGRAQGVVSSGSDIERVYVSFLESATGDYDCCTNNNRPCGGLRGSPCKHIIELLDEAIAGFRSLTEATVAPFAATLEALQDNPDLTGIAALLTRFDRELLRGTPTARLPAVPLFRWVDL